MEQATGTAGQATLVVPYRQKTWKHFVVSTLAEKGPQTYQDLVNVAVAQGTVTGEGAEKKAYDAITIACGEIRNEFAKPKDAAKAITFTIEKVAGTKQHQLVQNAVRPVAAPATAPATAAAPIPPPPTA